MRGAEGSVAAALFGAAGLAAAAAAVQLLLAQRRGGTLPLAAVTALLHAPLALAATAGGFACGAWSQSSADWQPGALCVALGAAIAAVLLPALLVDAVAARPLRRRVGGASAPVRSGSSNRVGNSAGPAPAGGGGAVLLLVREHAAALSSGSGGGSGAPPPPGLTLVGCESNNNMMPQMQVYSSDFGRKHTHTPNDNLVRTILRPRDCGREGSWDSSCDESPRIHPGPSRCDDRTEQELRALFSKYDSDQSGFIDKDELGAMLQDLGICDIDDNKIALIFEEVDLDNSGTVEFMEFIRFYELLTESLQHIDHAPGGEVAFVFTDIASSTVLWEQVGEEMDIALSIHNNIMRTALRENAGYEVKTIGDAFMVAFICAQDAAGFCLQAQSELNEADWPKELAEVEQAKLVELDGKTVLSGLRVRMGLHFGEVIKELNPLTRRADYRGPAVNISARVESQCVPGQILMTHAASEELKVQELDAVIRPAGRQKLKGVKDAVSLHAMVPKILVQRFDHHDRAKAEGSTIERTVTRRALETIQVKGLGKRLGMKLRRTAATVAMLAPCHPRDPDVGGLGAPDIDSVLDQLCGMLRIAVEAAEQARGIFEAAHGDEMTFGWNMSRSCVPHSQQAIRFTALIHARVKWAEACIRDGLSGSTHTGTTAAIREASRSPTAVTSDMKRSPTMNTNPIIGIDRMVSQQSNGGGAGRGSPPAVADPMDGRMRHHVGVANGRVLSGTVGTARQSFRTVFGRAARVARMCADQCAFLQTEALVARGMRFTGSAGNIEKFLRPVDVWRGHDGGLLQVDEIDVDGIASAEAAYGVWDFLADAECAGMGGGEAAATQSPTCAKSIERTKSTQDSRERYKAAFHGALGGSVEALDSLRGMLRRRIDGDPVLETVCRLLEQHQQSCPAGRAHRCDLPRQRRIIDYTGGEQGQQLPSPHAGQPRTPAGIGRHEPLPAPSFPAAAVPRQQTDASHEDADTMEDGVKVIHSVLVTQCTS